MSKILIIKHGALGDVVLATGPFQAIREHHKDDHITLLTTPLYAELLKSSPYFDEIWIDNRPKLYHIFAFCKLIQKIGNGHFTRIYDLQTSERTAWYHCLLNDKRIEWVGTAKGASHRHNTPERTTLHTVERQKQQLAIAGINELPKPNLDWLKADVKKLALPARYALIVAGGSSHRPGKRWPASMYGKLCVWLFEQGVTPVLIGTPTEASVMSTIESLCHNVINLQGKTNFADVAELARSAVCAIGNDTGPMHLIGTTGCPSIVLFSHFSNPALCAPRGPKIIVLQEYSLTNLALETVTNEVSKFL